MKTVFTTSAKFSAFIVIAALCLVSSPAKAWKSYPSVGIKMNWAGNGLATAPAFTIRYSFQNTDVDFGANFQLHNSRFSGYQANVIRYVTHSGKKIRLGLFAGLRYFYGASLKANVVAQEKWVQPESKLNFDELRIRCIEGQAGFGVRVFHNQRINTFYGIAFGAYQTLGETAQYEGMHREVKQAQLSLNCSLSYSFR